MTRMASVGVLPASTVRAAGPSGAGNRAECAVAPVGPTPAARTTTTTNAANEKARRAVNSDGPGEDDPVSVSPSLVLNDSTTAVVADPTDAPVVGKPARKLASAQGYCWEAIEQTVSVVAHAASFAAVDSQGDVLARHLAQLLSRMASMARREGAPQTEAMCREAIATLDRLCEMDAAEDWHVGQMAQRAGRATVSERQASSVIGAVLGQQDAVCGRQRAAEGGIEFDPCTQPAGHALDGTLCVFMARIGSSTAPRRRGGRRTQQGGN